MDAVRAPGLPLSSALPAEAAPTRRPPLLLIALTMITIAAIAVSLYMGLVRAGMDIEQGNVQRIFYIHMPSFFGGFVAFAAAMIGGIAYLRTKNPKWDTLSLAGVEVGLALAAVNLVTGMVWARPIWNTWWNWDPRLTAEAIMILTYAAYLMLRSGIENPETRRRFAAVYAILAITSVLVTLFITRVVPTTIHPVVIGPTLTGPDLSAQGDFELNATPGVGAALGMAIFPWAVFLPIVLLWWRIRLQNAADSVAALRMRVLNEG